MTQKYTHTETLARRTILRQFSVAELLEALNDVYQDTTAATTTIAAAETESPADASADPNGFPAAPNSPIMSFISVTPIPSGGSASSVSSTQVEMAPAPATPAPATPVVPSIVPTDLTAPEESGSSADESWYVITAGHRVGVVYSWGNAGPLVLGVRKNLFGKVKSRTAGMIYFAQQEAAGNVRVIPAV